MSNYAIINLKTDPKLKARAARTANRLGVSLSAVLNNELRRFSVEQSVSFHIPEKPNSKTAAQLAATNQEVKAGKHNQFKTNQEAIEFLAEKLE